MQITDTLVTSFSVTGISALLSAMTRAAAATDRITAAQARLIQSNLTLANSAFSVFQQIVKGVDAAIDRYVAFGNEVMNIRDLTGATAQESARAVSLFRVAGVSDVQQIREVLHLSQAVFSEQGRAALGRLGVGANPNVTGLALFNQIADALNRYPDGIMKAQIATEIFGARSVGALLPLLRLTSEQRERAFELGDAYNSQMLPAIQQFQFAAANLGETIEVRLIFPIVQKLMPAILKLIEGITFLIDKFAALDQATGGWLSTAAAFVTIAAAVGSLAIGLLAVARAALIAIPILVELAGAEALVEAFSGPWGPALVAASAAAVGVGLYAIHQAGQSIGTTQQDSSVDKFAGAVDRFDASINQMGDWQRWIKGEVPRGIRDDQSLSTIARQMALGAIG